MKTRYFSYLQRSRFCPSDAEWDAYIQDPTVKKFTTALAARLQLVRVVEGDWVHPAVAVHFRCCQEPEYLAAVMDAMYPLGMIQPNLNPYPCK